MIKKHYMTKITFLVRKTYRSLIKYKSDDKMIK